MNVFIRVGSNDYSAEVIVGKRKNGKMLLYDIINFKPTRIIEKNKKNQAQSEAKLSHKETADRTSVPDKDNVPQSGDVVNRQYMQSERNYPQSILDRDAQRVWAQMEGYEE